MLQITMHRTLLDISSLLVSLSSLQYYKLALSFGFSFMSTLQASSSIISIVFAQIRSYYYQMQIVNGLIYSNVASQIYVSFI